MQFMSMKFEESTPLTQNDNLNTSHALTDLSLEEQDAADNILSLSKHTALELMPNHCINPDGELQGFKFTASPQDAMNAVPLSRNVIDATCLYECELPDDDNGESDVLNADVIRIVANKDQISEALHKYQKLLTDNLHLDAHFACMPEDLEEDETRTYTNPDSREWKESFPGRVGIYHAFFRSYREETRQNRVFIVVSGHLKRICEEFYNTWQDCGAQATCEQLAESEEINWLRQATLRNHNRIAAQVASICGLKVLCTVDGNDPTGTKQMILPTTVTFNNDIFMDKIHNQFVLTSNACITNQSTNGILFDMLSHEGYYLFKGPDENSDTNEYGGTFHSIQSTACFPTKTVRYHRRFPASVFHSTISLKNADTDENDILLFPDENFYTTTEQLGFNRNNGIITLMPLVSVSDVL